MKKKCEILKVTLQLAFATFLFGLALLIIRLIFHPGVNNIIVYLYDLSSSIFACSLVIFFLSIKDYLNAKDTMMKEFWEESNSITNELKKLPYVFEDIPSSLLINYIEEESNNTKYKKSEIKHDAYNELFDYIDKHYIDSKLDTLKGKKKKDYIEEIMDNESKKLIEQINSVIPVYTELSNISVNRLNFLMIDTMFFKEDGTLENMYNYIYSPLYDAVNEIKNISEAIKNLAFEKEVYLGEIIRQINKFQSTVFTEEMKENKLKVSNTLTSKLEHSLETWKANIYKVAPAYQTHVDFEVYEMKFDDEHVLRGEEVVVSEEELPVTEEVVEEDKEFEKVQEELPVTEEVVEEDKEFEKVQEELENKE